MEHRNRLFNESSPYLLQHAHNPVDWFPWGDEALLKARQEAKPILVSIGYAACHWCHVMERESFEDEATAAIMNNHFVCIKIDREERPDLDHFFMDALQATSGSGGWPLNMFLTSEAKPFYGGTYFPPSRLHNRPSWKEVLLHIHEAFQTRKQEIEAQADNLVAYLAKSNPMVKSAQDFTHSSSSFSLDQCQQAFKAIMEIADTHFGGFGKAPKFPQTFTIQFLLRYHHFTGDPNAKMQAMLSLKSMFNGGIYDQVGGGFCRYSTDTEWLAPHFEKMTYDNALLLVVLAEAFQISKEESFKTVAKQTVEFMNREMLSAENGFYAALDADSEGVEGKYYVWTKAEFDQLLLDDADKMADWFDVTAEGNWEHVNILRRQDEIESWAEKQGMDVSTVQAIIEKSIQTLLAARIHRVRPGTDDKIILGWNALYNHALVKAAVAFGRKDWLLLAERNMEFLLTVFRGKEEYGWLHTYKAGEAKFPAFLDDLAYLVQALLSIYEPTGNLSYLEKAKELLAYIEKYYLDEEGLLFYYTPSNQTDILVRKKDVYDGAMPSGNAIMAWNLYRAGILFGREDWKMQSAQMLESVKEAVQKYPNSFGIWANLLLELSRGTHEILVLGEDALEKTNELLSAYIPNKVVMSASQTDERYPLMQARKLEQATAFYICRNYSCQLPFHSVEEVLLNVLTKS